ncbi:hypothetical protein E2542_SST30985 [Spatholobus suberectus]|nr:hypothetical protein E2542_SST30985 [Spatholobus suberectus]
MNVLWITKKGRLIIQLIILLNQILGWRGAMLQLLCSCSFSLLELPANYNYILTWPWLFLLGLLDFCCLLPFKCNQVWKGYGQKYIRIRFSNKFISFPVMMSASLIIRLYM